MSPTDWLGFVAGALTTAAFLPQAILTWKTRKAEGVSLGMYSIFTIGVAVWCVYGFMLGALPLIVCNVVTLALALFILTMKIRFG